MENERFDLLTFGEIMLRLSTPLNERIVRGTTFEKHAGGSELNVASGVSLLGLRTGVISKVPANQMGTYIKNHIRFVGVSDNYLIYDKSPAARLGIYYYENGAMPRKPSVVYDRKGSSINSITLDEIDSAVYSGTRMFHTSGISLALSPQTNAITEQLMKRFKEAGAKISFDVNYRATLWEEAEARAAIEKILPYVDILFVSEETSRRMFHKSGDLHEMMKSYAQEYGISYVASTQRTVISPRKHDFGSVLYARGNDCFYEEEPYRSIEVIDRIGSGDAYVAGVLFGLLRYDDPQMAVRFGNAVSAVKNTIQGDLPSSDFEEIRQIMESHNKQGEQSELNR